MRAVDAGANPSRASRYVWCLHSTNDLHIRWMLKYIRRGDADKAAAKAVEVFHRGAQLLAALDSRGQ